MPIPCTYWMVRCGIQEQLEAIAVLVEEREGEIVGALPAECYLDHALHLVSEVLGDEVAHEMLAQHVGLGEPSDGNRLLVPLRDQPARIDAEDGHVGGLDELVLPDGLRVAA